MLASMLLALLHPPGGSAFPPVDKDELVRMLGGRRGLGSEGRKVLVKGVEMLGRLVVSAIMGGERRLPPEVELPTPKTDSLGSEGVRDSSRMSVESDDRSPNGRTDKIATTGRRRRSPSPPPPSPSRTISPALPPVDHPPASNSTEITSRLTQISSRIEDLSHQLATLAARSPAAVPAREATPPHPSSPPSWSLSAILLLILVGGLVTSNLYLLLAPRHPPSTSLYPSSAPPTSIVDDIQANRAQVLELIESYRAEVE